MAEDQYKPMEFPIRGIDNASSKYDDRRDGSAQNGVNVRVMDALEHRLRGGSRPGMVRYPNARVNGSSLIQHLNTVVSVQPSALAGTEFDAGQDLFYQGDPSQPNVSGWAYTGDEGYEGENDLWMDDPGVSAGFPIPVGGSLLPPRKASTTDPSGSASTKLKPKVYWLRPKSIVVGTALSATQLNAVAKHPVTEENVAGTMAYFPAAGKVFALGVDRPLRAIFTPADLTKYVAAKGQQKITVTGSYSTAGPLYWPNVLDVVFSFATYTWETTATYDADTGRYAIDGLPHTLADVNTGRSTGLIALQAAIEGVPDRPGFLTADAGSPINGGVEITAPFPSPWNVNDWRGFTSPNNVTVQNPFAITVALSGTQTLTDFNGASISGVLRMAITGVAVP